MAASNASYRVVLQTLTVPFGETSFFQLGCRKIISARCLARFIIVLIRRQSYYFNMLASENPEYVPTAKTGPLDYSYCVGI